jgi:membrane protease YdiL (CAAX protease family)
MSELAGPEVNEPAQAKAVELQVDRSEARSASLLTKRGHVGHVALFLLICVNWYPAIGLASFGPVVAVAAFVATFVFVRWDGLSFADVGVALGRGSVRRAMAGFGIGLLLVAIHTAITASVAPVRWVRAEDPSISRTLMWFLIFVFFATREEWAYRGYPLRVLAARWGPWPAQITLAIVFGIEHALGGATWQNAMLGAGAGAILFGTAALQVGGSRCPLACMSRGILENGCEADEVAADYGTWLSSMDSPTVQTRWRWASI